MAARIYPWAVLVFWGTTMSWLVVSKVLPPLLGGQPPDYAAALSTRGVESQPVGWRISWNGRRIGTAVSQVVRRFGGGAALRQVVHFEQLPLDAMLTEGFGLLGSAMKPLLSGDHQLKLDLQLATELRFDAEREFTEFQTVVDLAHVQGFLLLRGKVSDHQRLEVTTRLDPSIAGTAAQPLRHEIDLPRRSLVSDAFAPRPELRDLHVGQKWTIPVYRPFPPNSPVRIVQAVAARLDVLVWNGRDVETILVEYREDAGSGLHASRDPIVREWVRTDGQVLRQEISISGLTFLFERLPVQHVGAEYEQLDPALHPRLWITDAAIGATNSSGRNHD
jgi:hypothetical protein